MPSAAEQLASSVNFGAIAKATELKQRIFFTLIALIEKKTLSISSLEYIASYEMSTLFLLTFITIDGIKKCILGND